MPEHLRAFIFVLILAAVVLVPVAKVLAGVGNDRNTVKLRIMSWLALTSLLFLGQSMWLYMVLAVPIVVYAARRDPNPLALFCFLLFAAPLFELRLPGLGLFDHLIVIDHYRLLALCILLPMALRAGTHDAAERQGGLKPNRHLDLVVIAFIAMTSIASLTVNSLTNSVRFFVLALIDIGLPYYVASRSIKTVEQFRDIFASFICAAAILSLIAAFEVAKGWLLYESLRWPMGFPMGMHITRDFGDGFGLLRPVVTAGNSIVLGYIIVIAIGMYAVIASSLLECRRGGTRLAALAIGGLLMLGLGASLSRGPWVACVALALVLVAMGRFSPRNLISYGSAVAVVWVILSMTPLGSMLYRILPFVGEAESFNVTYRQRLFDVSMDVILLNPVFGSVDYVNRWEFEVLKQGQGIVDFVNTYIQIALGYGLVGLVVFASAFLFSIGCVFSRWRQERLESVEKEKIGRGLVAIMIAVMLMIATVSSILYIPMLYWLVIGCCAAYREGAPSPRVAVARYAT